jgi:hypothetical protein
MGEDVNATFDFYAPGMPERRQLARIAAGIALSVLVHGLLLALYRQPPAPPLPAPQEPLTVRLREAPPPPVPVPQAEAEPAPAKPARRETEPRQARPRQAAPRPPRAVIAVEPEVRQSSEETYAVPPAPVEAPAPRFDLDAARSTARQVAKEPDPAKKGTALERLPPPALQTETKLERAIQGAKRRDCKDGVPGGLLAPLFLAMDKKDSGCKW